MKEVILIKNGELALKGLNRRTFEDMLMANIRRRLASLGKFTCTPAQSTIIVEGPEDADLDEATERLLKVFGIAGLSRAAAVEKDMDVILNTCVEYTAPLLNAASTFKVEAKRGVELIAIHFASPPYTSQRAEQKVHSLLRQVAKYSGRIMLFVVPFTEIQELIKDNCPEEVFTLIMRRMMMRISQEIAIKEGCQALITGESVGQVASQTMPAIACTDAVTSMPVFRPLIGMDKDEVIAISRKIETFDISIQPYEDCCTVFTPKHPRTHPTIARVEKAERGTEWDEPIKRAVEGTKVTVIKAFSKGE